MRDSDKNSNVCNYITFIAVEKSAKQIKILKEI